MVQDPADCLSALEDNRARYLHADKTAQGFDYEEHQSMMIKETTDRAEYLIHILYRTSAKR